MKYFTSYLQSHVLKIIQCQTRLYLVIIAALFHFTIALSQQSRMRKGPYLIYPNCTTQMTILWQLENSASCHMQWGLTPACTLGNVTTIETGPDINEHQHSHTLENLVSNRLYYYQVIENGVVHFSSFRSAPFSTADPTSFFIYGDTRTFPDRHDSIMACISSDMDATPSCQTLLLHTGDWCTTSAETYWDWEYFNRAYDNTRQVLSKLPVLGAIGNHEDDVMVYRKYWPFPYENTEACYYAFNYGLLHIAVVDQYVDCAPGSKQLQWLENDLTHTNTPGTFIMLHEPGFSDRGAHADNPDVQNYIHPLCLKYGVTGVLAGHNHFYSHCIVDGIHHLTFGGGGGPTHPVSHTGTGLIRSESSLNYGLFTVNPDSIAVSVFGPDKTIIDTFSIRFDYKPPPPVRNVIQQTKCFKIYVIPSLKKLMVEMNGYKKATLKIVNLTGTKMVSRTITTPQTGINLTSYPSGVYFIRMTSGKSVFPEKFMLF